MNLPLGIQDFAELRLRGCLYADKTAHLAPLLAGPKYCLLRRPPRFGKSLLLSTIECYLSGRRELFEGLAAEAEAGRIEGRPVFRISLSGHRFECGQDVDSAIAMQLAAFDRLYHTRTRGRPEARMFTLLRRAHEASGHRPAVLIDDFDRPLRECLAHPERAAETTAALAAFYSIFRTADAYISFALLAGTESMAFPGPTDPLGNFTDISLSPQFDTICGITPEELRRDFGIDDTPRTAEEIESRTRQIAGKLHSVAGGYRFSRELREVMNPDSLLRMLSDSDAFPSAAIHTCSRGYRVGLADDRYAVASLAGYQCDSTYLASTVGSIPDCDPAPMLASLGVLTISGYDSTYGIFTLDYPNAAVEATFMRMLLDDYGPRLAEPFAAAAFRRDVHEGRVEEFMRRMKAFFDGFPYDHVVQLERHFHNVVYVLFKALGEDVRSEVRTSEGRIDLLVQTPGFIYIMEFKLDSSPLTAIRQIEDRHYAAPFATDRRATVCIGISFSSRSRTLEAWEARMPDGSKLHG